MNETSILAGPQAAVERALTEVADVGDLLALSREEQGGQARKGVLNAIQNRIGAVVTEGGRVPHQVDGLDLFLAESGGAMVTREDIRSVAGNAEVDAPVTGGTVEHRTAKRVVMYFPEKGVGYLPKLIPSTNIAICLQGGARHACPDCGRRDCSWVLNPNGTLTVDPNECTGRPRRKFTRCPVCARTFYDLAPVRGQTLPAAALADEDELDLGSYADTTPEARLRVRMHRHAAAAHPDEAEALGIRVDRRGEGFGGRPTVSTVVAG